MVGTLPRKTRPVDPSTVIHSPFGTTSPSTAVDGEVVPKGEWITVDGSTGRVFLGKVPTIQPSLGTDFHELMKWADKFRRLGVRANGDTPLDAKTARGFGAEGIGLCRTEHM